MLWKNPNELFGSPNTSRACHAEVESTSPPFELGQAFYDFFMENGGNDAM